MCLRTKNFVVLSLFNLTISWFVKCFWIKFWETSHTNYSMQDMKFNEFCRIIQFNKRKIDKRREKRSKTMIEHWNGWMICWKISFYPNEPKCQRILSLLSSSSSCHRIDGSNWTKAIIAFEKRSTKWTKQSTISLFIQIYLIFFSHSMPFF